MNRDVRVEIITSVEKSHDEIVSFLQELIKINSVTGNEGEIQAFIASTLNKMGLEVDRFDPDVEALRDYQGFIEPDLPFSGRPNVVGIWGGKGKGKSILFNGHVDTVPLDLEGEWFESPLSGIVADGKIWGRGASDMKAGLAAMTMAVSILKKSGFHPDGDVILEYVVDEERTGLGTLACVHRGYKADAGICCETSDLQVMPACIGRMWFTIRLRGKPSGISARWEGVSAIEKAIKIVHAVDDLERIRIQDLHHPLYPDNRGALPCAVTMFQSGTFPSITPDVAILHGSMGLMPNEEPENVSKQLLEQIKRVSLADPWLRNNLPEVTTEGGYVAAGAEIPADHPIVQTVKSVYQEVSGDLPLIGGRMGAADTRFLIRNGNTPTVIFGPGVTAQMHAMNEYVPVENLITVTKMLALTIYRWCNNHDPL
jgi:acetylornithine deacetylase